MSTAISASQLVARVNQTITLPDVYTQLDAAIKDPTATFAGIANIIRGDTGLSSRLLRIVNSPFYGFPTRIESISHAITLVGTEQLRDLALATVVMQTFAGLNVELISVEQFWRHSVATAAAARIIAELKREPEWERYFVLGILHDIGRLVMYSELPDRMSEALSLSCDKQELLVRCERTVLGIDHAQVGLALLQSWRLPPVQRAVVALHHHPRPGIPYDKEVDTVHLADIFANAYRFGSSGEHFVPPLEPTAWQRLGLDPSDIPIILDRLTEDYKTTTALFL